MLASSLTARFVVVAALCVALIIPLLFVIGLVDERVRYHDEVVHSIASSWGRGQTLVGPILLVPETYPVQTKSNDHVFQRRERRVRAYLPDTLKITGDVKHEMRRRAIYEVSVYAGAFQLDGSFSLDLESSDDIKPLLNEARIVLGIADTSAIQSLSGFSFAGKQIKFTSGTGEGWLGSGVQLALPDVSQVDEIPFSFALELNGSDVLRLAPVGVSSSFNLSSSWPHPSFMGRYLPTSYELSDSGFEAHWQVHELARDLPSEWLTDDEVGHFAHEQLGLAEVRLFQPVTSYTLIDRGIKYALIFIGLTFLAYLCFELSTGVRLHYVQFGVIGAALVLFYLTLLSLSEHIAFAWAYVLATTTLVGLVGTYTWQVTREKVGARLGLAISGMLIGLYACLYVLLMLEDFALLVGTVILLLGLAGLMYATKGLRWAETDGDVNNAPN